MPAYIRCFDFDAKGRFKRHNRLQNITLWLFRKILNLNRIILSCSSYIAIFRKTYDLPCYENAYIAYAHVYVQTDYYVRIVILRMHYSTGKKVGAGKKLEEKMAT